MEELEGIRNKETQSLTTYIAIVKIQVNLDLLVTLMLKKSLSLWRWSTGLISRLNFVGSRPKLNWRFWHLSTAYIYINFVGSKLKLNEDFDTDLLPIYINFVGSRPKLNWRFWHLSTAFMGKINSNSFIHPNSLT